MSRFALVAAAALVALVPFVSWAANPHFTACDVTTIAGQVAVSGQVAGLGNQKKPAPGQSLTIEATTVAVCLDATTTPPLVLDSVSVADSVTYPPQNGQRKVALVVDTPFVLACAAPATIVFGGTQVCDVTHGICTACPLPVEGEEP